MKKEQVLKSHLRVSGNSEWWKKLEIGIAVYVSYSFKHSCRSDREYDALESVWLEVKSLNQQYFSFVTCIKFHAQEITHTSSLPLWWIELLLQVKKLYFLETLILIPVSSTKSGMISFFHTTFNSLEWQKLHSCWLITYVLFPENIIECSIPVSAIS